MICPIITIRTTSSNECQKEHCAWYRRSKGICCILDIAIGMEAVGELKCQK